MASAEVPVDKDPPRSAIQRRYAEVATSPDHQVYFYTGRDGTRRASYSDSLIEITGVGPATARLLSEAGFISVPSIADAEPSALAMVRGIGPERAASLRTAARRLLAAGDSAPTAVAGGGGSKREKRSRKLRKHAQQLRKQAGQLSKKAKSTKSKKKRKRRLREAAKLETAARKARQKAKNLIAN